MGVKFDTYFDIHIFFWKVKIFVREISSCMSRNSSVNKVKKLMWQFTACANAFKRQGKKNN